MPVNTAQLEIAGMPASTVFETLVNKGLPLSDASVLLSSWIYQNTTTTFQTFDYAEAFPPTDADCTSTFARSFHHADWMDGESVVQAGQTTGEDGFNLRFHQIEADVDLLGANVAKAFTCLGSMRQSLASILEEIRTELNRLRAENNRWNIRFSSLPQIDRVPNLGGLTTASGFLGTTTLGEKVVSAWQTDKGLMLLPAVNTIGVELVTNVRIQRAATLARGIAENVIIIRAFTGRPVSKAELVKTFGDIRVAGGQTIRELTNVLPDSASFPTLDLLVQDVSEREAAALRTSGGVGQAVSAALGIESSTQPIDSATVDQIKTIPAEARSALLRQGIDTIGKLAATPPAQLTQIFVKEGLSAVSAGDIAEWTTTASTLTKIKLL